LNFSKTLLLKESVYMLNARAIITGYEHRFVVNIRLGHVPKVVI